jgi:hypothetical protein
MFELLLSQERVLSLLYAKTFPVGGAPAGSILTGAAAAKTAKNHSMLETISQGISLGAPHLGVSDSSTLNQSPSQAQSMSPGLGDPAPSAVFPEGLLSASRGMGGPAVSEGGGGPLIAGALARDSQQSQPRSNIVPSSEKITRLPAI